MASLDELRRQKDDWFRHSADSPLPDEDRAGFAGLRYYPLDDLMFGASYLHLFDNELGVGQIEYQTPIHGLSLFAEVAMGEHDYEHALIGAQFYLGKSKSLIRRHREDDPPNIARQVLDSIGVYGAEYNQKARQYVEHSRIAQEDGESQDAQYTGSYGSYGAIFTCVGNYGVVDMLVVPPGNPSAP